MSTNTMFASDLAVRQALAAQIQRDVDAFLANGGVIKVIPYGYSTENNEDGTSKLTISNTVQRKLRSKKAMKATTAESDNGRHHNPSTSIDL